MGRRGWTAHGADIPVAVVVPSVNSKDQGFDYLGVAGGELPIVVVGDSIDKWTGHDVAFLFYANDEAGAAPIKPRRWSTAGPVDDVPVGATYALTPYVTDPGQPYFVPIVIAAGYTTLAGGQRDTFITAITTWQPTYPPSAPKAGTFVGSYPMVFHTAGRSNTPVDVKATRDGIYVAGTSQSLTDSHDAKMFLAKFDYAPVAVPIGQVPGPRWVEYSTPLNETAEERAVAIDFVVEPNPGVGTWLYVAGNRTGDEGLASSFVTMQAFDALGATGSDPTKKWKGVLNRPPSDHGTGNDVLTCMSASREPIDLPGDPNDPEYPNANAPMVTVTGSCVNNVGARSVILTAKYTSKVPASGNKAHRWYMVTSSLGLLPSQAYYYPRCTEVRRYGGSENRIFVGGGLWQPCGQGVLPCAEQLFVTSYVEVHP